MCETRGVLDERLTYELAEPITCSLCGFSSRDAADFMGDQKRPRCVRYFACSRRQDEAFVTKKYGEDRS